jgi:septin family protein
LQHSTTACFYFLPFYDLSKVDLVAVSALSQHVALLPVLTVPDEACDEQARDVVGVVQQLLEWPDVHVQGLPPIQVHQ